MATEIDNKIKELQSQIDKLKKEYKAVSNKAYFEREKKVQEEKAQKAAEELAKKVQEDLGGSAL